MRTTRRKLRQIIARQLRQNEHISKGEVLHERAGLIPGIGFAQHGFSRSQYVDDSQLPTPAVVAFRRMQITKKQLRKMIKETLSDQLTGGAAAMLALNTTIEEEDELIDEKESEPSLDEKGLVLKAESAINEQFPGAAPAADPGKPGGYEWGNLSIEEEDEAEIDEADEAAPFGSGMEQADLEPDEKEIIGHT
jgi:hypothetical protein